MRITVPVTLTGLGDQKLTILKISRVIVKSQDNVVKIRNTLGGGDRRVYVSVKVYKRANC